MQAALTVTDSYQGDVERVLTHIRMHARTKARTESNDSVLDWYILMNRPINKIFRQTFGGYRVTLGHPQRASGKIFVEPPRQNVRPPG